MDATTYLKNRVEDQIGWMEKRSERNQRWYLTLKLIEMLSAAFIPILAGFYKTYDFFPVLTGILGVIIVICNSLQQLNRYHENWITYRTTIESLKREKFLFESQAYPYQTEHAFPLFVQHFEDLLATENRKWKQNWQEKELQPKTS